VSTPLIFQGGRRRRTEDRRKAEVGSGSPRPKQSGHSPGSPVLMTPYSRTPAFRPTHKSAHKNTQPHKSSSQGCSRDIAEAAVRLQWRTAGRGGAGRRGGGTGREKWGGGLFLGKRRGSPADMPPPGCSTRLRPTANLKSLLHNVSAEERPLPLPALLPLPSCTVQVDALVCQGPAMRLCAVR